MSTVLVAQWCLIAVMAVMVVLSLLFAIAIAGKDWPFGFVMGTCVIILAGLGFAIAAAPMVPG